MATNFNPATKISVSGPLSISDKRSADMPLDIRGRIETLNDITTIPFAWEGMLVYVRDTKKYYKVTSLANRTVGGVAIPYYPATWVEFGSGGSTPSPTPSEIDAGDVSYFSSGTFSNNTVGKELQSLASDISGLLEDIHNLSGDIGTLSSLGTEYQQDLVGAINEVLAIKVAGIKVQGESGVLPMDRNGIVTIPAGGGGGTGTITGATVGGNPVTASGGILQFDAYPTVPITSIETSDHATLTPNNGLITLPSIPADQSSRIKKIEDSIAQMGNNQPIVIPSSAVELPVSTSDPDYIDYDSDTTYVMNIDGTQVATIHYPYVDNNNNYVAFKAIDRDLYYAYSVSVVNDTERYTYSNQYTWSTLPVDAKSKFESGIYAIKQVINDDGTLPEKKWYKNIPSAFVDKNNFPLRTRRINETISSSVIDVLLVKNDRLNKIYRYAFNGISNAWVLVNGGCYTKDDATTGENYTKYDAYFDRQSASNVSFDDSITQFSTLENPVHDVQTAINVLATAIASGQCIFSVTVKDYDATLLSEETLTVSYNLNGTTTVLQNIVTDTNGNCVFVIPYGATYSIEYPSITDRLKPNTSVGIATNARTLIQVVYELSADNEELIINVQLRNCSTTDYSTNNKKVYIYYKINGSWNNTPDITVTLNNKGSIATNGVEYKDIVTPRSTCLIPRGTQYKVALQEWNPEISSDLQDFIKSEDIIYTANDFTRQYNGFYYYKKAGVFLVIEDYEGDTDLNTWTEYRCISADTTNWIATIQSDEDNKIYDIKYDGTYGLMRKETNDSEAIWEQWYSISNLNRVLGVGFRSSELISVPIGDETCAANGFVNSCFIVPANVSTISNIMQSPGGLWSNLPDTGSGKNTTNFMIGSTSPVSDLAIDINNITKKIGNFTQHAFIGSIEQLRYLRTNRDILVTLLRCCNNSVLSPSSQVTLVSCTDSTSILFTWVALTGSLPTSLSYKTNNNRTIPLFAI